ncbi:MAG TPA: branched-chain amino acid ABC transporter permease [Coriobacteriia bacterium]|nr:MAG: Branched-chain amino acid ABC transporter, membrane protein [Actinobacteria bacterium 66_15]HAL30721.1 branched-chain amino acid ABC transporter permease [Coriobacteriia bacterium]
MTAIKATLRRLLRAPYSAVLLVGLLAAAVPLVSPERYVLKVMVYVGVNVIIIAGLALLFGYAGQISMGHAAFVGIGAYTSAYLVGSLGMPWLAGVAAGTLLAAAGGLVLALPALRLHGHYLAMATLGFAEIMHVVFREARHITGGNDGLGGIAYPEVAGYAIDTPLGTYLLVWGVAIAVLVVVANIVRSRPGRAMQALHATESGALACGVDTVSLKVRTFAFSAGLAGLAGALYAHSVGFISPTTFGLEQSVILVAMVVVGGTGSLAGPVIAAIALTLLPYADALIPGLSQGTVAVLQDWETDIYGIAMILVVIFAPAGIGGLIRRAWSRRPAGAEEVRT